MTKETTKETKNLVIPLKFGGTVTRRFIKDRWEEDLIWCPSQLYQCRIDDKGNKYILYLRWRWTDPWQAHIYFIEEKNSDFFLAERTCDIFEKMGLFIEDDDYKTAEEILENAWERKYKSGRNWKKDLWKRN